MRYRFTKGDVNVSRNHEGWVLSIILNGEHIENTYMLNSKVDAIRRFQYDYGTYPDDYIPVGESKDKLAIMEVEHGIDTYVYVTDHVENGFKNITKNRVKYDAKGRPYFKRNEQRYYLCEFMKVV